MMLGKEYVVQHRRKGIFAMRITSDGDAWVTGIVTEGTARARTLGNDWIVGDEITIRKSLAI